MGKVRVNRHLRLEDKHFVLVCRMRVLRSNMEGVFSHDGETLLDCSGNDRIRHCMQNWQEVSWVDVLQAMREACKHFLATRSHEKSDRFVHFLEAMSSWGCSSSFPDRCFTEEGRALKRAITGFIGRPPDFKGILTNQELFFTYRLVESFDTSIFEVLKDYLIDKLDVEVKRIHVKHTEGKRKDLRIIFQN